MNDPIHLRATTAPAALAVCHNSGDLTYAEFERRIDAVAGFLAGRGVEAGEVAAYCVLNSLDGWVVGFALRRLGVTTLAVLSPAELAATRTIDISALVVSGAETLVGLEQATSLPVVSVPPETMAGLGGPSGATRRPGGHLLLTSGTTGSPKQVLVDEATISVHLARRAAGYRLADARLLNICNWGVWTSLGYLLPLQVWGSGGTVVIRQPADFGDPEVAPRITHAIVTPATLADILRRAPPAAPLKQMALFVAGGPLPVALAAETLARVTPQLFVVAGSTEVGVWAQTPILRPEDVLSHLPLPGADVEVVDEAGRVLPEGEIGVVRMRALPGVTQYRNDSEATSLAFRGGFFYPGDMGLIGADGRLVLKGRSTDVIAAGDRKLAPDVIEDLVASKLGAIGVCAFSQEVGKLVEELHLVIHAGAPISRGQLEALARGELRGFPQTHFHFVDELPRNDRGKLLRSLVKRRILG